jgi:hypothetical protein
MDVHLLCAERQRISEQFRSTLGQRSIKSSIEPATIGERPVGDHRIPLANGINEDATDELGGSIASSEQHRDLSRNALCWLLLDGTDGLCRTLGQRIEPENGASGFPRGSDEWCALNPRSRGDRRCQVHTSDSP